MPDGRPAWISHFRKPAIHVVWNFFYRTHETNPKSCWAYLYPGCSNSRFSTPAKVSGRLFGSSWSTGEQKLIFIILTFCCGNRWPFVLLFVKNKFLQHCNSIGLHTNRSDWYCTIQYGISSCAVSQVLRQLDLRGLSRLRECSENNLWHLPCLQCHFFLVWNVKIYSTEQYTVQYVLFTKARSFRLILSLSQVNFAFPNQI